MTTDRPVYVVIPPSELWGRYADIPGLLRGGGNATDPKLVRNGTVRDSDFTLAERDGGPWVLADATKGMSFADNLGRLKRIGISGKVWLLPQGTVLPEGLAFIVKPGEEDHPLLAVTRDMPLADLVQRLSELTSRMRATADKI